MAGRGVDIKLGGNPATPEQYEEIKAAGGLFVLGTERHEARRIDNQLRGRSGRQGDPGATQFFVSLEDDLMRIFASDTISKMMGRFGIPEDQPIATGIITRSLESAQTKIEGFHFDSRKHVLEYDDVLNLQRLTIYSKRQRILNSEPHALDEYTAELVANRPEEERARFTEIIEEKKKQLGADEFARVMRRLFLQTIDTFWVDHLEMMDYLRSSVRLRAYGQRDPLVEYKREGLRIFKEMEASIMQQIATMVPALGAGAFVREEQALKKTQSQMELINNENEAGPGAAKSSAAGAAKNAGNTQARPVVAGENIGRNDPCPCGSGKKYKKCHGA
jgi:preprotein translocase subunit SecA